MIPLIVWEKMKARTSASGCRQMSTGVWIVWWWSWWAARQITHTDTHTNGTMCAASWGLGSKLYNESPHTLTDTHMHTRPWWMHSSPYFFAESRGLSHLILNAVFWQKYWPKSYKWIEQSVSLWSRKLQKWIQQSKKKNTVECKSVNSHLQSNT